MSRPAGIYDGIPDEEYHADKESLSVSGAKKLLPPSCPAIFKWERDNGQPHKAAFDFGHAAHAKVLGVGAKVLVGEFADYRTKDAQRWRDDVRAGGMTPLLRHEADQVDGMAEAIKAHPIASALLDPAHGKPEQSGYWLDEQYDVTRRLRLDWLPDTDGGRLIVPDYKSAISAEPAAIRKAVANFGYFMQQPWYVDGLTALGVAEDIAFVFIFQEKTAPYVVTVVELHPDAVRLGRMRNDQALQVYADCMANDTWPGYADDVELISLPKWATYGLEAA